MKKAETSSSGPIKKSEMELKVIISKKEKMMATAAATTATTTRNWAAGDVVEARRGGGTKNWSSWQLATVWGPAARGGYYWLRFLKCSEVVRVPASRIRPPKLACISRIRDVELETILMHVGGKRDNAAQREEDDDDEEEESSSVGSNDVLSSESENDCSIYSSDESRRHAETTYRLQRAAYMSGMIIERYD